MKIIILIGCLLVLNLSFGQSRDKQIRTLLKYYPQIVKYENNKLFLGDGSSIVFDDSLKKNEIQLLENPDIEDQFHYDYPNTWKDKNDAGRIRNENFFKKIYGHTQKEVENNLAEIIWCPKLVNKKIKMTRVNNIDKVVTKLSEELDQHPEYAKYLKNIGGTFMWRYISGTSRLSNHSFGTAIDINVKYSNYWQWDCRCKDENKVLAFKNHIPEGLVKIFEKHGFIWGGRWLHYDTMHFEYRPELLE